MTSSSEEAFSDAHKAWRVAANDRDILLISRLRAGNRLRNSILGMLSDFARPQTDLLAEFNELSTKWDISGYPGDELVSVGNDLAVLGKNVKHRLNSGKLIPASV